MACERGTIRLVRTLLRWIVVTVGIAAFVRWLRERRKPPGELQASEAPEDPAEELRRKLAESRTMEPDTEAAPPAESSVDARRAEVHEQGRAALAEMTPSDEG
jgi:hypothetical protein